MRSRIYPVQGLGTRGFGRPLQVVIGGPDYQTLSGWSDHLLELARANPGLVGVETNFRERKPQIDVAVDRDRAAELGVSLESVGRTLETVLGSRVVTTYVDRGREYKVILQGESQDRAVPSDLQNLYVRSDRSGELVPLANLVQLTETSGAMQLNRFDRMRSITISAGLAPGYTLGEAVPYFQELVRKELPPAARLSFDGESREYLRTQGQFGHDLPVCDRDRVPGARCAVRELQAAGRHHDDRAARADRRHRGPRDLPAGGQPDVAQHLQPDRDDHAGRNCREERRADRRVRQPAARPGPRAGRGRHPGRDRSGCARC